MMMHKDQTHIKRNCFSIGIISSKLQSGCYSLQVHPSTSQISQAQASGIPFSLPFLGKQISPCCLEGNIESHLRQCRYIPRILGDTSDPWHIA
jgi:hypothetical protein